MIFTRKQNIPDSWILYHSRFTWYVNGVQFRDTVGQIEVYYPMANRCIARFPIPQKGEYKVIAENRAGKAHSIGFIDIKNGNCHFPMKYFSIKFKTYSIELNTISSLLKSKVDNKEKIVKILNSWKILVYRNYLSSNTITTSAKRSYVSPYSVHRIWAS